VMYGRNSSTPLANTALVLGANSFVSLDYDKRNSL
jgi:hypothetical protein